MCVSASARSFECVLAYIYLFPIITLVCSYLENPSCRTCERVTAGRRSMCANPAIKKQSLTRSPRVVPLQRKVAHRSRETPIRCALMSGLYAAFGAAGHHGCTLTCQAPICAACSRAHLVFRYCLKLSLLITAFPSRLFRASRRSSLPPRVRTSHTAAFAVAPARPFAW